MSRKRFIKLCMKRVSRNDALRLVDVAKGFDGYAHAYSYLERIGCQMFYAAFRP